MSPLYVSSQLGECGDFKEQNANEPSPMNSPTFTCQKVLAPSEHFHCPARTKIPVAVEIDSPLNFAVFMNNETSAKRVPTPSSPFVKPAKSSCAKSVQAKYFDCAGENHHLVAPLTTFVCHCSRALTATTIAVIKPAMPISPAAIVGVQCRDHFKPTGQHGCRDGHSGCSFDHAFDLAADFLANAPMAIINSANRTEMAPREAVNYCCRLWR